MIFLLIILLAIPTWAKGPRYSYKDPHLNDEISQIYYEITKAQAAPRIFKGSGAPASIPTRIGDIYVSTTTSKVYLSTGTATSASWAVLN